jgi:D-alanyl-lipoteichoic acid acyltransferase DltB (MBOAT superfamily)
VNVKYISANLRLPFVAAFVFLGIWYAYSDFNWFDWSHFFDFHRRSGRYTARLFMAIGILPLVAIGYLIHSNRAKIEKWQNSLNRLNPTDSKKETQP